MLRSVSVENYRSFAQKATIELRPITILLGRNSAGKSSLTRLFPLLRQSMERGTSAPILWNSSSVDFGRITDVINRDHPNAPIRLTFDLCDQPLTSIGRSRPYMSPNAALPDVEADLKFTAVLRAGVDGKTHYEKIELMVGNDKIVFEFKISGSLIYINDRKYEKNSYWKDLHLDSSRLFPYVLFESKKGERVSEYPDTRDELYSILQRLVDLSNESIPAPSQRARRQQPFIDLAHSPIMPLVSRPLLLKTLFDLPNFRGLENVRPQDIDRLADLLLLTHCGALLEYIGSIVTPAMQNLSYLGPIRASGNRFYREQELSVDRIDDTGENLATYLGSLSPHELASFNNILRDAFGVEVRPHSEAGHLSIEIGRPGDEKYDNLADVGFGYSQVLPLVAQIHSDTKRNRFIARQRMTQILISAVEQPELHLHPAYQANLADLFVAAIEEAKRRGDTPIVILETHSEALISRIGELISYGRLSTNDVAVHFVDKDDYIGGSTVRVAEFDEYGMIVNWPVGFFSAR
ncbi:DUF3696 domain-containing protein [Novosphingobium lindaniclasticum]|uniref:DUF3696 domain-containing protein n=1 Tax=Novosphingobium lindaniclasticum TaxID=1329895 RepID=UPI000425EF18|nr:DUF3696 domain-containing protein [Novosphingobium lindaniclasticum]